MIRIRPNRIGYLVLTVLFQVLLSGIIFGWNSVSPLLQDNGVFSAKCEPAGTTGCDEQKVRLTLIFTIAAALLTASGVLLGPVMDRFGLRVVRVLSAMTFSLGLIFLAVATNESLLWFVGFACLGFGGGGIQLTSFNISMLFPGHENAVVSLIAGSFAASSSMFFFAKLVHTNYGTPLSIMFEFYTIIAGACVLTSFLWPDKPFSGLSDLNPDLLAHSVNRETDELSDPLLMGGDDAGDDGVEKKKKKKSGGGNNNDVAGAAKTRWIDHSELTLVGQLKQPESWLLIVWFALALLITTFFLSSVSDQLHVLGDDGGHVTNYFGIIYPLGFVGTPIVGMLQDSAPFPIVFLFVNVALLVYQCLTLVPNASVQIATFIVFAISRQYVFALFYASIGTMFGYKYFGFITGVGNLASALSTLLTYPMLSYCTFKGEYWQMNVAMTVCLATQLVAAFYFWHRFVRWRAIADSRV